MKPIRTIYTLLLAMCCSLFAGAPLSAQSAQDTVTKETHLYAIKGKDSLLLDRYYIPQNGHPRMQKPKPCLIFVFGGGFFTGKRDQKMYLPYYQWLAEKGMEVIAIDYRLGLKPLVEPAAEGEKKKIGPIKMVNLLFHSVNMAVEDFYDATAFVLSKATAWGIDPSLILSCGSSAGAITVLQGEYYRANKTALAKHLPDNFKYAGIIAFAGAIAKKGGRPHWKTLPSPIQLFHGNADSNVPYDEIKTILGGLYGSKAIAKSLSGIDAPHYFLTADNQNHAVAVTPMNDYRDEIETFIDTMVLQGEPLVITETLGVAGEPVKNKKFGIKAFIRTNFLPKKKVDTLLSYNVHNCIATDSARTRDYQAIARVITQSKAEVAALQELDSVTTRTPLYVLGKLAEETGMHATYAPAIEYGGGKYGIGILSKEQPLAVQRVPLPGREEKRVLLIAEFEKYIFCSTHLSLTPEDRLASVEIIRKSIGKFQRQGKGRKEKPVFVGGDFNAEALSETITAFCRYATPVSNTRMNTFPSAYPNRCIDYIFVMGKKMPRKMEVISTGRIQDTLTRTASDHLPVYSVVF